MTANSRPTLYDRLGVSPTAPLSELRRAYRLRALALHPDVSTDSSGEMAAVNEAWAILSDPATRARYDACVVDHEDADPVDAVEGDRQFFPEDSFEANAAAQWFARLIMGTLLLVSIGLVAVSVYAFTRSGSV